MKSQAQSDVEAARKLPQKVRDAASRRWSTVHSEMIAKIEALPVKRRPKNFEVHHAITVARAAFLARLVSGADLEACRSAALQAFGEWR